MFAIRAGHDALERERQTGQTLIERIDRVEALALRNLSFLRQFPFASILIFATSVFYSWKILSLATSLFSPSALFFVIILYSASVSSYNARHQRRNTAIPDFGETRRNPYDIRRSQEHNASLEFIQPFQQLELMSEEEQMAEAMARSLAEQ